MDKLQTSTMPAAESDSQKLQRLGFVQTYSEAALSKGYEVAGSVYSTTRGYVPAAIEDKVSWGEDKVSEISTQYGAPLVNTVQDKSQQILGIVDSQVDTVAKSANNFYEKNSDFLKNHSDFHSKNLTHFKEARDAYIQQAKDAIAFLKEHGAKGTVQHAIDQLATALDNLKQWVPKFVGDKANLLLEKVTQAWDTLYNMPTVQKTLETVSPSVELAKKKYTEAHDAVVKAPSYDKAFNAASTGISKAQDSYPYKTAANRLYPLVSPVTDPVLEKASPYVNNVLEHIKPQHTAST